jgi:hypothetical protein
MWRRLTQVTGAMWLALGACFLLSDVLELSRQEFSLGWSYYVVMWGYLACCIGAGLLLLSGVAVGKWFVTALAVLLATYAVLVWGKAEGAPFHFQLWCASMFAFGVWSICLVHRRNA